MSNLCSSATLCCLCRCLRDAGPVRVARSLADPGWNWSQSLEGKNALRLWISGALAAGSESEGFGLGGPVGGQVLAQAAVGRPFGGNGARVDGTLDCWGQKGEGQAASERTFGTAFGSGNVCNALTLRRALAQRWARARFCCRTGSGRGSGAPETRRVSTPRRRTRNGCSEAIEARFKDSGGMVSDCASSEVDKVTRRQPWVR